MLPLVVGLFALLSTSVTLTLYINMCCWDVSSQIVSTVSTALLPQQPDSGYSSAQQYRHTVYQRQQKAQKKSPRKEGKQRPRCQNLSLSYVVILFAVVKQIMWLRRVCLDMPVAGMNHLAASNNSGSRRSCCVCKLHHKQYTHEPRGASEYR